MDYIFWLIIGLVLMAIELVIPGGIAGLIGYCLFMWGVFIGLGGTDIALYAVLGITIVLVVVLLTFFNHFSKTWIGKLFTLGQRSTTKAGYVSNDGNLVDVVTEGDFIDAGSPIVVLRVVGGRNIVRKRD